jgi:hypothetical protein
MRLFHNALSGKSKETQSETNLAASHTFAVNRFLVSSVKKQMAQLTRLCLHLEQTTTMGRMAIS